MYKYIWGEVCMVNKKKLLCLFLIGCVLFALAYWAFVSPQRQAFYHEPFKLSFEKDPAYIPTPGEGALSGKLSENVTYAFFYSDVYALVGENIRASVPRSAMDFHSAIFNAGFTNPIYLASFIKNLFNDEDYEFYRFEKVTVGESIGAYRCYFESSSTRINGRCYFTVDDARFYVFVFYISSPSEEQTKEEKLIDSVVDSFIIYPYDYNKE